MDLVDILGNTFYEKRTYKERKRKSTPNEQLIRARNC